jgi:hypothetical protein
MHRNLADNQIASGWLRESEAYHADAAIESPRKPGNGTSVEMVNAAIRGLSNSKTRIIA